MNNLNTADLQNQPTAEELWDYFKSPLVTGEDYINSLRGRDLDVYLFGEKVAEPVDHPMIRPSMNALARGQINSETAELQQTACTPTSAAKHPFVVDLPIFPARTVSGAPSETYPPVQQPT